MAASKVRGVPVCPGLPQTELKYTLHLFVIFLPYLEVKSHSHCSPRCQAPTNPSSVSPFSVSRGISTSDFLLTELDLISFSPDSAAALSTWWPWPPVFALSPVSLPLRRDVMSSSLIAHRPLLMAAGSLLQVGPGPFREWLHVMSSPE